MSSPIRSSRSEPCSQRQPPSEQVLRLPNEDRSAADGPAAWSALWGYLAANPMSPPISLPLSLCLGVATQGQLALIAVGRAPITSCQIRCRRAVWLPKSPCQACFLETVCQAYQELAPLRSVYPWPATESLHAASQPQLQDCYQQRAAQSGPDHLQQQYLCRMPDDQNHCGHAALHDHQGPRCANWTP